MGLNTSLHNKLHHIKHFEEDISRKAQPLIQLTYQKHNHPILFLLLADKQKITPRNS
jgi:hypothetical protein